MTWKFQVGIGVTGTRSSKRIRSEREPRTSLRRCNRAALCKQIRLALSTRPPPTHLSTVYSRRGRREGKDDRWSWWWLEACCRWTARLNPTRPCAPLLLSSRCQCSTALTPHTSHTPHHHTTALLLFRRRIMALRAAAQGTSGKGKQGKDGGHGGSEDGAGFCFASLAGGLLVV